MVYFLLYVIVGVIAEGVMLRVLPDVRDTIFDSDDLMLEAFSLFLLNVTWPFVISALAVRAAVLWIAGIKKGSSEDGD